MLKNLNKCVIVLKFRVKENKNSLYIVVFERFLLPLHRFLDYIAKMAVMRGCFSGEHGE